MAKNINKDVVYKAAKSKEKDYMLNDGEGLYLFISKNGSKLWRFIYTYEKKQRKLALGGYPAITLELARRKAEDARSAITNGKDPSEVRSKKKKDCQLMLSNNQRVTDGLPILNSFADLTAQWLQSISHLTSESTQTKKTSRLKRLALPLIGDMSISAIKSSDVLAILKPLIDKKQLETAHRLRGEISSIFSYAIVHDFTDYDPAQAVTKQLPAQKVKHRAAIIEPLKFGQLLRDISNYTGTYVVQCAFRFSPLVFQRPGEIRQILWSDIDLDAAEWKPYISKTDFHHIVPLSTQAISILKDIKPLTGSGQYVFPSSRGDGRSMSDGTIRTALKSLGYDSDVMTAHGFRTTASTLLNEQGWSPDAIERQLAHAPRDHVRAAYNRAQYLDERRRMMQSWSDYLEGLTNGAQILGFKQSA